MARKTFLFTSESVSEGHPDKVCDRISDEVVDAFYREGAKEGLDPWGIRAACETMATTNRVIIAGESRGPRNMTVASIEAITRDAIKDIGYEQEGFHWANCNIEVLLHSQSADIAAGVDAQLLVDVVQPPQQLVIACGRNPPMIGGGHMPGRVGDAVGPHLKFACLAGGDFMTLPGVGNTVLDALRLVQYGRQSRSVQ